MTQIIESKSTRWRRQNPEKHHAWWKKYYAENKTTLNAKARVRKQENKKCYRCIGCKKLKWTTAKNSYICRPCLCKRNFKKAQAAAAKARTLKPYEALYRSFLRTATHEVEISFTEFKKFIKIKKCHYCDSRIIWRKKSLSRGKQGVYIRYNLDRKDSNIGYTVKNCVVCCPKCNRVKSNFFSENEFKEVVALIKEIRGKW